MRGYGVFFELSHMMSALGKDSQLRGGVSTPSWNDLCLSLYGEYNIFLGIPLGEKLTSTELLPYSALGVEFRYQKSLLAQFQPYARFGMFLVWPHPTMTTVSQNTGIKGGIGMVFFPREKIALSVGVDFLGMMENGRAEKIIGKPVYHQGVQVSSGIILQF